MRRAFVIGGVVAGVLLAAALVWVWWSGRSKALVTAVATIAYEISGSKQERAKAVAPIIDANRGDVPFGAAMAICEHESGFNPNAVNPRAVGTIGHARGLFQIMDGYQRDYGVDAESVYDPEANARGALGFLNRCHASLVGIVPTILDDYETYTYCLYLGLFAGRGGMMKKVQAAVDAGQGVSTETVAGYGHESGLRQVARLAAWWEDKRAELLGG